MEKFINNRQKVSNFITSTKQWNVTDLSNILQDHIIGKIKTIHVPITNVEIS